MRPSFQSICIERTRCMRRSWAIGQSFEPARFMISVRRFMISVRMSAFGLELFVSVLTKEDLWRLDQSESFSSSSN